MYNEFKLFEIMYFMCVAMALGFFIFQYKEIKNVAMARVLTSRMREGKSLKLRWAWRNEIVYIVFMGAVIICPILNAWVALGVCKMLMKSASK